MIGVEVLVGVIVGVTLADKLGVEVDVGVLLKDIAGVLVFVLVGVCDGVSEFVCVGVGVWELGVTVVVKVGVFVGVLVVVGVEPADLVTEGDTGGPLGHETPLEQFP